MLDRWDPWSEFDELWKEMDRLLSAYLDRLSPEGEVDFVPPAEVGEVGDEIVVRLDLPGVLEEDIDITLRTDRLTIRGEREPPPGRSRTALGTSEIRYGLFVREISLPKGVEEKGIRAGFSDGMLTIRIPHGEGRS